MVDDSPTPDPLPPAQVPTPGQAFALFAAGFVALALAAQGVEWIGLAATAPPEQWAALLADPTKNPVLNDGLWIVALTAIPEVLLGLLVLGAVRLFRFSPRLVLPVTLPSASSMVGALLLVFGVAPVADVLYSWLVHASWVPSMFGEGVSAASIVTHAVAGRGFLGLGVALIGLAIVPAIVEEALFRGFVTAAYRGSDTAALLGPSILFGLYHLDPPQAVATAVLGLAFGLARLCTGSLLASMAAHATYNAAVLILAFWGDGGGDETPSFATVLAGLAAAVIGLQLLIRRPPPPGPVEVDVGQLP
ncbi:MAG: CPBP family intramembrane metalloprotease [Polyangiaceae bacterium]|nr:CPBP family intramembrane metalloprotease [Polyangiaceae bacterium]